MQAQTTAVAYIRVSTREQGESGLGLDAQAAAITEACERRGWPLAHVYRDIASGKSRNGRPGLAAALERLRAGQANALVVSRLDRVARSMLGFAEVVERSRREGWSLVILEPAIDLSTASGRMLAGVLSALAEWERDLIGERTRVGLAEAKRRGAKMGLPDRCRIPPEVIERIVAMRHQKMSYHGIARALTEAGVPTALGGKWAAETVRQAHLSTIR
jgi:DNA invertase Pin-like site-specific DNA recombinase